MLPSTYYAVLLVLVLGVGCGKKEPELSTEKVITPDEAANKLFVEAVELVSEAKSKEGTNLTSAIKSYEEAVGKVRKIVSDYKESDIAVKLVSGETLFTGKSMAQIEERVRELQEKLARRTDEKVSSGVTSAMAKKLQGAGFEFNITSKREIDAIWIKPGTTITPETLGQFAELKNLQRLQLRGCNLNDVAVSKLGSFIHLKQLDLRDNPDISDKVIVTLKKFTKLEKLGLDGTRITSRGNTDLKTVLTNCEISWKPLAAPEEKDKGNSK